MVAKTISEHFKSKFNETEKELDKFDPAWAKAALYFRSSCAYHLGHGDSIRCQSLLAIREQLELRRKGYESGNYSDILHAVKICADENLPMPEWLAIAFTERFTATLKAGGMTSLDEAFSAPNNPSTENKRKIQLRDTRIGGELWWAVWMIIHNDETITSLDYAIDEALKQNPNLGVAKTKARELILERDETQKRLKPDYQALSHYLAKRRKLLLQR